MGLLKFFDKIKMSTDSVAVSSIKKTEIAVYGKNSKKDNIMVKHRKIADLYLMNALDSKLICTDHIYDSSWEPRTINFVDTCIDRICSWCHDGCAFILDGVAVGSRLHVGRGVEGKRCRMGCGKWCGKRRRASGR